MVFSVGFGFFYDWLCPSTHYSTSMVSNSSSSKQIWEKNLTNTVGRDS